MKKLLLLLMLLLALCSAASAEKFTAFDQKLDTEKTTYIDFGNREKFNVAKLKSEVLDRLPNLTRVDMYKAKLSIKQMSDLFDSYPNIFFGWTVPVGDHIVRTDITAFSTLHGKDSPPHTASDFKNLRFCKNLLAIDIGHNKVANLNWLKYFPKLRVLIIGANSLKSIAPLAKLKDLQYLEMFSTNVKDLSPLAELTNLVDLSISHNQIKNLTPLYGLTKLRRLWCGALNVTDKQYAALRKHLPNCRIYTGPNPTGGSWRKEEHYEVIREMFHYRRYIPFADAPLYDEDEAQDDAEPAAAATATPVPEA